MMGLVDGADGLVEMRLRCDQLERKELLIRKTI